MMLIPDQHYLFTQQTHITHLVPALSSHRSNWRSRTHCVMSSHSCSVISFFPSLFSFPERMRLPFASLVSVRGQNNPFWCLTVTKSLRCLKDSTNSWFCSINCDTTCNQTRHFLYSQDSSLPLNEAQMEKFRIRVKNKVMNKNSVKWILVLTFMEGE